MGIRIIVLLAAYLTSFQPAAAQQRARATADVWFHVAPNGSDNNGGCLDPQFPCATAQYAYSRAMADWDFVGVFQPYIKLAPGVHRGLKMTGAPLGSHSVNVVGQQSNDIGQSCSQSQAEQVVVEGSSGETIFDTQDLAVSIVRCLTVRAECIQYVGQQCVARAPGVGGFLARQTPATDIGYVKFDVLGTGVVAKESGAANLGGMIWLGNNMTSFLFADTLSRISVAAPIVALNSINVTYLNLSYQGAHTYFYAGSTLVNPGFVNTTGSIVYRDGSIITNGFVLPNGCRQADPTNPAIAGE